MVILAATAIVILLEKQQAMWEERKTPGTQGTGGFSTHHEKPNALS